MVRVVAGWKVEYHHRDIGERWFTTTVSDPVVFTECGRFVVFHIGESHKRVVAVDGLVSYTVTPV